MDPALLPLLSYIQALQRSWTVRSTEAAPDGDGVSALVELNLLGGGGDAAAVDASDELAVTLGERSRRFGKPPVLLVNLRLPRAFPGVPPEVRVLEPVFVTGTGGVCNGNALLPCLWPEGWPRNGGGFALTDVLGWLRDHVLANGALLESDSNHFYSSQAWAASRAKLLRRPDARLRHSSGFSRSLCVFGSEFATTVLGLSLPDSFDAGNKVLLPAVCLAQLAQGELRALLADGPGEAAGAGGAAGAAASRRRLVERLRRGGAPEDEFVDGSAMVFELVSALRFPVFVGVAAFSVPHADALVVPPQVLQSLGVPEGSEITLSRVALPPATGLVLQPHTVNFEAVEAFTDRPPREFLEASLTRFGCLAEGDVIKCDGGPTPAAGSRGGALPPHEFWFTVVETRPAPAVALWSEFTAQLPIEFVPAADSFVQTPPLPPEPVLPPPRLRSEVGGAAGTGVLPQPVSAVSVRPATATAFAGVGRTLAASSDGALSAPPAPAQELRSPRPTGPAVPTPIPSPSRGVLGAAAAGLMAPPPAGAGAGAAAFSGAAVLGAPGGTGTAAAPQAAAAPPAGLAPAASALGGGSDDREERRRRAAEAALRRSQQLPQP